MPTVGSKIFPYTSKGIQAAGKAAKSVGQSIKTALKPSKVNPTGKLRANEGDADYIRDLARGKKKMQTSDGYMKLK